ncbi:MAG: EamA family transporter [Syntrophobacteraceae bacterium]
MWYLVWPILLVVCANTFYNICAKSTPDGINAFAALSVTYVVAAVLSIMMFFVTSNHKNLIAEISNINWASVVLAISVVSLEYGYISIYRAGWKISIASLVANISLACVLLVLGLLLYKETISLRQFVGMIVCVIGIFLIRM